MLPVLAVACKHDLRKTNGDSPEEANEYREEVSCWLTSKEVDCLLVQTEKSRPVRVIGWLGGLIVKAHRSGRMGGGDSTFAALDDETARLFNEWMGMNKICFTPTPFPYIHCLHWFVCLYLSTLPVALVTIIGWWSIVANAMLACAMYAVEEVAMEIEDPFGDDLNDLPIEVLAPGLVSDFDVLQNSWSRPLVLAKDGLAANCLVSEHEALWTLSYTSVMCTIDQKAAEAEVNKIVLASKLKNKKYGITGKLLYNANTREILQVLEGPRAAVLRVYDQISNDTRHCQTTLRNSKNLIGRPREYESWMGLEVSSKPHSCTLM